MTVSRLLLLLFTLVAPVAALPSGTYLLSDYEKQDRVYGIMKVKGKQVEITDAKSQYGEPQKASLSRLNDKLYRISIQWDYAEPRTFQFIRSQEDWFMVFPYRESDKRQGSVLRLTRVQKTPIWLKGSWVDETGKRAFKFTDEQAQWNWQPEHESFGSSGYAFALKSNRNEASLLLRGPMKRAQVMKLVKGQIVLWDTLTGKSHILSSKKP